MLFPTQQSAATATTNLVGSILKDIEKRQAEEEEKTKGTKDDKILKAQVKSDDAQKAANDKINAYFFDRTQGDASNNRAVLIREVGKFFGLDRETFKSDSAFAREVETRLKDLKPDAIDRIEKELGLNKFGISLNDLIQALKNPGGRENALLKAALGETSDKAPQSQAQAAKAVDRLKSVAAPRSLEEAQLESLHGDPTRKTDKQSLDEQEQQVHGLHLQEELEAVADRQDLASAVLVRLDDNGLYGLAALGL
ncbi:MAG TPA: hypothetical protein VGO04_05620 [Ensifer sp.]|jgi:hypothetical protein|uniref:hypothetical protein n=1 Tax=Ensifer sp. TaxID=1872086 RepID=UPI002E10A802|nr:hypothetical protein [Ensifer sp.]